MQKSKIKNLGLVLSVSLAISGYAWADAPVVSIDQAGNATSVTAAPDQAAIALPMQPSLPIEQRVKQLEQQMGNLTQMNFSAKLDDLHQQIQQLQGQVEEQNHTIKTLQDQLNNFYQDINQRLDTAKTASSNNTAASNSVAAANDAGNKANSPSEQAAYQKGLSLLTNKKYDPAAAAFKAYLQQYPAGQYAVNANYWLGEIYFQQNKFTQAGQAFQAVINTAPKDAKVPDAKLKLALIHDQAGHTAQARKELQRLIHDYPGTSAAQLAKLRLKSLQINTTTDTAIQP